MFLQVGRCGTGDADLIGLLVDLDVSVGVRQLQRRRVVGQRKNCLSPMLMVFPPADSPLQHINLCGPLSFTDGSP